MATKLIKARVLNHLVVHGAGVGTVLEASAELIAELAKSGDVDPNKAAVAYAVESGAQVVRSAVELAGEAQAQLADSLRIRIAELEQLLAGATDDATKSAIAAELADRQAELAATTKA